MIASSQLPAPTLLPLMRYRDLVAALKWLEEAFEFEKQVAVSDTDGTIIYAQMTCGNGMVMLSSVRETDLDKLMRQPDEVGDIETQSCYIVVDDADAHYARALEAGAEIVLDIKSDSFGRRGYSCRDPQGHIWNFGTYNPGKSLPAKDGADAPPARRRKKSRLSALAFMAVAGLAATWWWTDGFGTGPTAGVIASATDAQRPDLVQLRQELAKARAEKRTADLAAEQTRRALEEERNDRQVAEAASAKVRQALEDERSKRTAAETANAKQSQVANEEAPAAATPAKEPAQSVTVAPPQATPPVAKVEPASENGERSATETSSIEQTPTAAKSTGTKQPSSKAVAQQSSRIKRAAQMTKGGKPTYVVEMSDVPWPYNTWYRK